MKLAVFGATGRTGVPLVEQALDRGHAVRAFARDPDDVETTDDRLTVVAGDAYTGEGVAQAIAGPDGNAPVDAAVSVLGQTKEGPDDLLTVAGEHILDAMRAHGVDRFVTLVGAGVREPGESVSVGGRVMNFLLALVAGEVLDDAEAHVDRVKSSDAVWTVVRGPRLVNGSYTGNYRHGTELELGMRDSATRANVAAFVLDCIEGDSYHTEMPKVTDG